MGSLPVYPSGWQNGHISFSEFRQRISIEELALANGYSYNRKHTSKKYPVLDHKETTDRILIINPQNSGNQGYANVRDDFDKGTLIDFVRRRLDTVFRSFNYANRSEYAAINAVLYHHLSLPQPERERIATLSKSAASGARNTPVASENAFRAELLDLQPLQHTQFLESRGLHPQTLKDPIFAGTIFNIQKNTFVNTSFPFYNQEGVMVGLEERNHHFKGHAENSVRGISAWHSNLPDKIDKVLITESAIDAISYHQLYRPQNILYFSTGGNLSLDQVKYITEFVNSRKGNTEPLYLIGFDSDKEGGRLALRFLLEAGQNHLQGVYVKARKDILEVYFPGKTEESAMISTLFDHLGKYNAPYTEEQNRLIDRFFNEEISKMKFNRSLESGMLKVEVPNTFRAITYFNDSLIQSLSVSQRFTIVKSSCKDFNEELQTSLKEKTANNKNVSLKM